MDSGQRSPHRFNGFFSTKLSVLKEDSIRPLIPCRWSILQRARHRDAALEGELVALALRMGVLAGVSPFRKFSDPSEGLFAGAQGSFELPHLDGIENGLEFGPGFQPMAMRSWPVTTAGE